MISLERKSTITKNSSRSEMGEESGELEHRKRDR